MKEWMRDMKWMRTRMLAGGIDREIGKWNDSFVKEDYFVYILRVVKMNICCSD